MINPLSEKLILMEEEGSFQVPGKTYTIAEDTEVLICLVVSYKITTPEKAYNKNIREELLRILQVPLRTIHEKRLDQLQQFGNNLQGEISQKASENLGVEVEKIQLTYDVVSQPTTTLTYSALAFT
ncbi:hypothetical protein MGU_08594 [Metarhizium guizhouense ARSEF 977]|uniref:Uncharacterized protein n=1 Tax=Metarhizium guizhouense (strain ARSEF 977) TaxID=1276136 RepID=A0A0B4GBG0_METGA|nr:hypothetical protein MGU_08594 [Metarhizium guizhouense ARSEF 977]